MNWGSVPDWFTVVFAFVALLSAISAAKAASGQLAELKKDGEARDRHEEQAQASQVAVWLDKDQRGQFLALYVNTSSMPIYEATVGFVNPKLSEPQLLRHRVLGPSMEPGILPGVTDVVRHAAARDPSVDTAWVTSFETVVPVKTLVTSEDGSRQWKETMKTGPIGLSISFTDNENQRWNRDISGKLAKVDAGHEIVRTGIIA